MKAEINIDTDELVSKVINAIKPMLTKQNKQDDGLYTVEGLAEYLKVSKQWIYERIHLNEIPFSKIGKFPRFRKSDIDNWLSSKKTPAISAVSNTFKIAK